MGLSDKKDEKVELSSAKKNEKKDHFEKTIEFKQEIEFDEEITIEKGFEVWEIKPEKLILLKNPSKGFYFIDLAKKNIITLED